MVGVGGLSVYNVFLCILLKLTGVKELKDLAVELCDYSRQECLKVHSRLQYIDRNMYYLLNN